MHPVHCLLSTPLVVPKKTFCAQAQDFRVVPWENDCIFIRFCLKTKIPLVKLNFWLLQLCCITLTSDQNWVDFCFSLSSLSLSDVASAGNLR